MKNEFPEHDVQAFYSGGLFFCMESINLAFFSCKQYGIQLCNRKSGEISHILKCRGITQDFTTEKLLNYRRFKANKKAF